MKSYNDIAGDGGSNIVEQVIEHVEKIKSRISSIKHIIAVMSGKGGVGKSSVTVNTASALAMQDFTVGVLDADINGPSIAKMTGVHSQELRKGENGILPAEGFLGLKIMSMDLFLNDDRAPVLWDAPSQKDAHTWRGMMEATAVREFLSDTEWGTLDFLLIDLPPGADKLPNLMDIIPDLSGTIIVTIPTGISQFVVGKSIQVATNYLKTPVIGLIENMSGQICPHCGKKTSLYTSGKTEEQAGDHGVPFLGTIPFDSQIAHSADLGESYMNSHADSITAKSFHGIAEKIKNFVN